MKKLVVIMMAVVSLSQLSFMKKIEQNDPKAKALLDEVSKKYSGMSGYKALFTFKMNNNGSGIDQTSDGEIMVKGNKFKLKLNGQEIYNNGTKVWTYDKETNEVLINDYESEEDDINPTKIYSIYQQGYKYMLMSEQNDVSIVELNPLIPDKSQISKVRIVVSKKDKTIKSWKVFFKNGNIYEYSIKSFTPNITLNDVEFSFDKSKYPSVKIVDLTN